MTVRPPDESPDKISAGKSIESEGKPIRQSPTNQFESYMQGASTAPKNLPQGIEPGAAQGTTPMDLSRGNAFQTAGPSFESILAQAKTAQDSLGNVGNQLKTQNLKFKRSQSHLLRNKLTDANEYLHTAGAKIGAETPPSKVAAGATPIDRFLSYVNDGQDQLLAVQQKLKELSASGQQISPADMMLVQVKMNLAQQEIEYSSTLLGKVIDSIKTIMNTQL